MIKHFYSYHVEIDSLIIEIESLPIEEHEKRHLVELAESQVHNAILDSILSELITEDKRLFLKHLNSKNHEIIWKFLRSKVKDIEEKIEGVALSVKKELYRDIREIKGQS
ncbi:MAG: hypothetical protein A3C30_05095 [Candidatus Levybacteria bacterium RIFCSPHIGHO2_02_FULL_40_18]|nr:MAG: hypothetical protein A2869_02755 [Candidatus Levybacteria bacterium RIFCSPHIGHO2_01_FULL_40_58]OGH26451.1 MAG: hypothetical protein A3C30_05095 [Candidatus Levybacteria bacterium RIFCSPHIGHO2_02_FULL_40_18]OGH31899.1 MAG: hypothetical protein A3E43_00895 [Candidatus Levybacteria bacterium RIFCSPHIGHO2_12_FULL_40_31]OGH40168.1 MAG: hypothetical protein A2894_04990 [Candidatus Levybacteria bacterium RIFCSPLOWO2_01_FULL_40_64]OGH49292.1 MAG: hypothetical protein A3I54_01440 [Candidatus Lev